MEFLIGQIFTIWKDRHRVPTKREIRKDIRLVKMKPSWGEIHSKGRVRGSALITLNGTTLRRNELKDYERNLQRNFGAIHFDRGEYWQNEYQSYEGLGL